MTLGGISNFTVAYFPVLSHWRVWGGGKATFEGLANLSQDWSFLAGIVVLSNSLKFSVFFNPYFGNVCLAQ